MERQIRGNLLTSLAGTVEGLDGETGGLMRSKISPQDWQAMTDADQGAWYALDIASRAQRAIFESAGDAERGYAYIVQAGNNMAESSMQSFLRLVVKLMTPQMLANRWPSLWTKSYRNFGVMTSDTSNIKEGRLSLALDEVDGYPYLGPLAEGFIASVLKAMGLKDASVQEGLCARDQALASAYRVDIVL